MDLRQPIIDPDLIPNRLTFWKCSWKNFLKKLILKKNQQTTKHKDEQLPCMHGVKYFICEAQLHCSKSARLVIHGCLFETHCQWSHCVVSLSITLSAALYWFIPERQHRKSSQHDWKFVDWDVKLWNKKQQANYFVIGLAPITQVMNVHNKKW